MNMNDLNLITIRYATSKDKISIEELAATAFGPGRFSRAAFRLREGVNSRKSLSFVAEFCGKVVGSVGQTPILIGEEAALVLGPLVVDPEFRKFGIGRELMNRTLHAARNEGYDFTILVGDLAYYGAFGFEQIPQGQILLPGPADPMRILGCELRAGAGDKYSGLARRLMT